LWGAEAVGALILAERVHRLNEEVTGLPKLAPAAASLHRSVEEFGQAVERFEQRMGDAGP
jgi:predicted transcriptional regulator